MAATDIILNLDAFARTPLVDPRTGFLTREALLQYQVVQKRLGDTTGDVQPKDATLTAIAGVTTSANKLIYFSGIDLAAACDFTAFARSIVAGANAAAVQSTLGLVIGTNVQAHDAELDALASVTSAADKVPYFTGSGTASVASFTSYARNLVDDPDAATARSTLGLGSVATQDASNVDFTGGTIDGAPIGATTPATGKFTTLEASSYSRTPGVTVASLPAAATAGDGARAFVTDATATTFHSTVAGGGANKVPVVSDGTNWLIG